MDYRNEYERWLKAGACEPLSDEKEIEECFYKNLKFGTGGIRAIMGPGPNKLNVYTIRKNTEGFARFIESKGNEAKNKGIVIAYDNRRNSELFSLEAAKVLASHDIHVYLFESLRTTPELSFAIPYLKAQGGINITASHNPPEYNGYKTYDEYGCQSVLRDTDVIIQYINSVEDILSIKIDESKLGNIETISKEVDEAYYQALESVQERPNENKEIKIVYTPLHGTGNIPVRTMLNRLAYQVYPVEEQCVPDPDFSQTKSPNPENKKSFEHALALAKKVDADLIVATDPDCDRLGLVCKHHGEYVYLSGNQTGAILLEYLLSTKKEKGTLPKNGIVFDTIVTASLGAEVAKKYGVEVESTLTGFKFIGDKIREYGDRKTFLFGYEESYGYMIKPFTRDKDGVQSTILAAEAVNYYKRKGKTFVDVLNELYDEFGYLEDVQENETLPGKEGLEEIQRRVDEFRYGDIQEIEGRKVVKKVDYKDGVDGLPPSNVIKLFLEDGSWVVIRPSGNEPKIKYYKNLWKRKYEERYQNWLANVDDISLKEELVSLNEEEKKERFYSELEFGTSGLRGVLGVGTNRLNVYTISQLSQAVADYLNSLKKNGTFAIAYDSRINSELFAHKTASVLAANGIHVYIYKELMPVPTLSYIIRHLGLDMGVMITASHNPAKYNGYKVYGSNGVQISKEAAKQIVINRSNTDEFKGVKQLPFETGLETGAVEYISEKNIQDYIDDTLKLSILGKDSKKDATIVYSPLNGAGRRCVSEVLKKDGFKLYLVKEQEYPDGNFPTCPKPNPELHETLNLGIKLGEKVNADIVMATDPDSDRIGVAIARQGNFEFINGNELGLLIFDFICNAQKMPKHPCLVKTVVTSDMFYPLAKKYGVEVIESLVGFKSICDHVEELLKEGKTFVFGLEESYGYLSRSDVRDKDAVNAALLIAEMTSFYKEKGINLLDRLTALYQEFGCFESSLLPYEFEGIHGKETISSIMEDARNGKLGTDILDFSKENPVGKANMVKISYEDGSSLLIRPSGTEPKIKFYFQTKGKTKEESSTLMRKYQDMVANYIDGIKKAS